MLDHIETMLVRGVPVTAPMSIRDVDAALFRDAGTRSTRAKALVQLLRHPELRPWLVLADSRLSEPAAAARLPQPTPALPKDLIKAVEAVLIPAVLFPCTRFPTQELRKVWLSADEGLLRLGAAVLGLGYAIDYMTQERR